MTCSEPRPKKSDRLGVDVTEAETKNSNPEMLGPLILLQGPVGGFFGGLARHLQNKGIPVHKVAFNLADIIFDWSRDFSVFNDSFDNLEEWYISLFKNKAP